MGTAIVEVKSLCPAVRHSEFTSALCPIPPVSSQVQPSLIDSFLGHSEFTSALCPQLKQRRETRTEADRIHPWTTSDTSVGMGCLTACIRSRLTYQKWHVIICHSYNDNSNNSWVDTCRVVDIVCLSFRISIQHEIRVRKDCSSKISSLLPQSIFGGGGGQKTAHTKKTGAIPFYCGSASSCVTCWCCTNLINHVNGRTKKEQKDLIFSEQETEYCICQNGPILSC